MKYAGFWPRLGAIVIDGLLMAPLMWLAVQLHDESRMKHLYVEMPLQIAIMALQFWLVYRYGGTIGKLVMGIRIRMLDGAPITLRAALWRHSVDWTMALAGLVASIVTILSLTDSQFVGLDWKAQYLLIDANHPAWVGPVSVMLHVWVWGELLVMLTNKKRRALHDFIAGTVVIRLPLETAAGHATAIAEQQRISPTTAQ